MLFISLELMPQMGFKCGKQANELNLLQYLQRIYFCFLLSYFILCFVLHFEKISDYFVRRFIHFSLFMDLLYYCLVLYCLKQFRQMIRVEIFQGAAEPGQYIQEMRVNVEGDLNILNINNLKFLFSKVALILKKKKNKTYQQNRASSLKLINGSG